MYIQLTFENLSEAQKEIIIAALYAFCEGFEELDTELKAIVTEENFNAELKELVKKLSPNPRIEKLPDQNWNQLWESNFEPVVVDDFVAVRANFHQPILSTAHEIVITPKMSFGTGHHATTFLMMQFMREIDFKNTSVFDFGTGTGILAILAKKLGATKIIATDIDANSIENAAENFSENQINDIELFQSESALHGKNHDVIFANINKNVLMKTIPQLAGLLKTNGILLVSGFLETDENDITTLGAENGLKLLKKNQKNNWLALKFGRECAFTF
jgi:ribosomal protein L11 methyltransferase